MAKPSCQYDITPSPRRAKYNVTGEDGKHLFHACNTQQAIGKPSLTLYGSADTSGLVVGIARNPQLPVTFDFYLGDPGDPYKPNNDATWETMVSRDLMAVKYAYQVDLGDGQLLCVNWKETSHKSHNLTNDDTEQVMVVFRSVVALRGREIDLRSWLIMSTVSMP